MHKILSYDVQCDKKRDTRALVLRLMRSSSVCNERERKVHNPDVVDKRSDNMLFCECQLRDICSWYLRQTS
jgi:hypothetical protein